MPCIVSFCLVVGFHKWIMKCVPSKEQLSYNSMRIYFLARQSAKPSVSGKHFTNLLSLLGIKCNKIDSFTFNTKVIHLKGYIKIKWQQEYGSLLSHLGLLPCWIFFPPISLLCNFNWFFWSWCLINKSSRWILFLTLLQFEQQYAATSLICGKTITWQSEIMGRVY